jgi:hypothetical protein
VPTAVDGILAIEKPENHLSPYTCRPGATSSGRVARTAGEPSGIPIAVLRPRAPNHYLDLRLAP